MSEWYLYDDDGAHQGPVSTHDLAKGIRAREIAPDVWVAPQLWFERPGASGWRRADSIAEISERLASLREGGLRVVDGAFTVNRLGSTEFGATVMMIGSTPEHERGES